MQLWVVPDGLSKIEVSILVEHIEKIVTGVIAIHFIQVSITIPEHLKDR
jgi:hypothetical protein